MAVVPEYKIWHPGVNTIYDRALLEECQSRAEPSNPNLAAGCLTPRRHQALFYLALGLSQKTISEHMSIAPKTVETVFRHTYQILDAVSATEASLKGIAIGALGLAQLVTDEEKRLLAAQLTGSRKRILDSVIADYGRGSKAKDIAEVQGLSQRTVQGHLQKIMAATNSNNKTRLAVVRFSLDY